jgi:hypothetical protein
MLIHGPTDKLRAIKDKIEVVLTERGENPNA